MTYWVGEKIISRMNKHASVNNRASIKNADVVAGASKNGHASVITCGCRFNRFESEEIRSRIKGSRIAGSCDKKLVIVNSCAVTSASEAKSRRAVKRAVRDNPGAKIVVAGCWAELNPESAGSIEGVDLVLGNAEKFYVEDFLSGGKKVEAFVGMVKTAEEFLETKIGHIPNRTAAYLKIQNGCDENCSFCVVRLLRGKSRSARPEFLLERADDLISQGAREIVLTGINIGAYGKDLNSPVSLAGLLAKLSRKKSARFRISSINPLNISSEMIAVMADSPNICKHLHVPLQSASDAILRGMERRYRASQYREKIREITEKIPGIGLGCDVMTGFPGETQEDFQSTKKMLIDLPFTYAHVFSYSPREKTAAFKMEDSVTNEEKKERTNQLKKLSARKNMAYRKSLNGKILEVLVETRDSDTGGFLKGKSDTFVPVEFRGSSELTGKLLHVRVSGLTQIGVKGSAI